MLQASTMHRIDDHSQLPDVVYTFVEEPQLGTKRYKDFRSLLLRAKKAAMEFPELGGIAKAVEFSALLESLEPTEDEEESQKTEQVEEEEEAEEEHYDEEDCDCIHCAGCAVGSTSYHRITPHRKTGPGPAPGIEVVRVHLRALEDLEATAPLIAPRLPGHVGTIICLHCLNVHTPWDGREHLFAPLELAGTLRVVFVLADACSWHDYPDTGTLGAGGVAWMDILDVESMDRADALLERLIDHEAALLGGQSEKIVLMGMSQGGGQSMLRFLRSKRRLGGWIGAVCHAPTAPHTPRDRDPLVTPGRPLVNCDRPMRLLAGEEDTVFSPGLVLRDAERLRRIGLFQDVEVEVRKGMAHDVVKDPGATSVKGTGKVDDRQAAVLRRAEREAPELLYVQKHLPKMLGMA